MQEITPTPQEIISDIAALHGDAAAADVARYISEVTELHGGTAYAEIAPGTRAWVNIWRMIADKLDANLGQTMEAPVILHPTREGETITAFSRKSSLYEIVAGARNLDDSGDTIYPFKLSYIKGDEIIARFGRANA